MTLPKAGDKRSPCMERYRPAVNLMAYKLSRGIESSDAVQDLTACGWLGIVESAQRYDGSVEFLTYAYPRMRGAMLDEVRARFKSSQRRVNLDECEEMTATLRSPESLAEDSELSDQIGVLPPAWGRVILAHLRGETLKKAGEAEGVSEVRAHQLYGKAVARLVKANAEAT